MGSNKIVLSFLKGFACTAFGMSVIGLSHCSIDKGEGGVVVNRFRGTLRPIGEGTHFLFPIVQTPHTHILYDFRLHHTFRPVFYTKDLQRVNVTVSVSMHLDIANLHVIFKDFGFKDYDKKVVPLIGRDLSTLLTHFNTDTFPTDTQIHALIHDSFIRRGKELNLVIDEVTIQNISFEPRKLWNRNLPMVLRCW